MVFNFRNKGLGRVLFLKTIILISLLYINAKNNNKQNFILPNTSISYENMDDSNLKSKRIYIFDELGISIEPTSFGAINNASPKYFILDEIEKARSSELTSFKLLHILADSLSRERIKKWRRYSYRSKILAKQDNPEFLTSLNKEEYRFYIKSVPYLEKAKEIAKITGLDEKIFLSLFYAESGLTHFARSSFDNEAWGLVISPMNALGLAQITNDGLDLLDSEYQTRKYVLKKRKKIQKKLEHGTDINQICNELKVGKNYVLYLMEKSGKDISKYELAKEETDYQKLTFSTLEEAADYDNMIDISFAVLNQLLDGTSVDKDRYQHEPIYAFAVGSAYFYLDYIYFLNHPDLKISRDQLLEVCVSAYNRGRYGTQRSIIRRGENWRSLKYRETRGHWRSFQKAYSIFSQIEEKRNKAQKSNIVRDDIS